MYIIKKDQFKIYKIQVKNSTFTIIIPQSNHISFLQLFETNLDTKVPSLYNIKRMSNS